MLGLLGQASGRAAEAPRRMLPTTCARPAPAHPGAWRKRTLPPAEMQTDFNAGIGEVAGALLKVWVTGA